MKLNDIESVFSKWRIAPGRTTVLVVAFVCVALTATWVVKFVAQKAAMAASRQSATPTAFKTRIDGRSVSMQGTGDTYSSAVRVAGARNASDLGKALRDWLSAQHPGFTYDSAAIPVTHDQRTYLSLRIRVGSETSIVKSLYFDITEVFDVNAVVEGGDPQEGLLSLLNEVALSISGELGRSGLATPHGPIVIDHSYIEESTRLHSSPIFRSESSTYLEAGFQRSREQRNFRDPLTGVLFARTLGALDRTHINEFEPGWGYGLRFVSTNSLVLTVYLYDALQRGIPNALDGNVVRHEFLRAREEVLFNYSDKGRFNLVFVPEPDRVAIGRGNNARELLLQSFTIEHKTDNGGHEDDGVPPARSRSVLLLSGIGDAFVKVRATYPESKSSICQVEMADALDDLALRLSQRSKRP